mmetsp:Transcript_29740/g.43831  ORF Transcript_29740/g.43831 Transcript_29740/m.43831 type:complete len:325 (-) Transcript_29740:20-994(-)
MGIDKPDVRYVIHWTVPKTLEGFYQESGRGGRDGLPATSLLYYSKDDVSRMAFVTRKSKKNVERALASLQQMTEYCMQPGCRRAFVLQYFGETINPASVCKKTCDYCKNPKKVTTAMQSADVYKDVMRSASFKPRKGGVKEKWDGQWNKPFGDDDDQWAKETDDWTESGLAITRAAESMEDWNSAVPVMDNHPTGGRAGFVKANAVLSKYETMESKEADAKEGRRSTSKSSVRYSTLPEHLRKTAPDPLQHLERKSSSTENGEKKSSSQLSSEVDRLKAELQQLNKDKDAARLAALLKSKKQAATKKRALAPPPMMSFGSKKRK